MRNGQVSEGKTYWAGCGLNTFGSFNTSQFYIIILTWGLGLITWAAFTAQKNLGSNYFVVRIH